MELVHLGRTEGPSLEYKAQLYDTNDRGSRELLLDICSMGNANGGTLLLGIAELRDEDGPTGRPDPHAPLGLDCNNPEQVLAAYEGRILDCIDQRLSVESASIELRNGRKILALRVPNSLVKPHRVFYKGLTYFPARRERQRYDLNASEVREMVLRTTSRLDEAKKSIREALDRENEAHESPILTVAIIPIFTRDFAVDFRRPEVIHAFGRMNLTAQGQTNFIQPSFSVDGLNRPGINRDTTVTLAHNGLIRVKVKTHGQMGQNGTRLFNPETIDLYLRGIARGCGEVFAASALSAPALLGARLLISGQCYTTYGGMFEDNLRVAASNQIYPTLLLEALDREVDQQMRPLCDLIHQSFGETHSGAFDNEGNWIRG